MIVTKKRAKVIQNQKSENNKLKRRWSRKMDVEAKVEVVVKAGLSRNRRLSANSLSRLRNLWSSKMPHGVQVKAHRWETKGEEVKYSGNMDPENKFG
jgi:hypothetical protein